MIRVAAGEGRIIRFAPAAADALREPADARPSSLRSLPRLALVPRQAIRRLALDDAHGLGLVASRRALDVVDGRAAAESQSRSTGWS